MGEFSFGVFPLFRFFSVRSSSRLPPVSPFYYSPHLTKPHLLVPRSELRYYGLRGQELEWNPKDFNFRDVRAYGVPLQH